MMLDFFNFFQYARCSERSQCIEPDKRCNCNVLKSMFECFCALCLCGMCSRALVNQGKMSCSKFQLSARMKRKNLDLDEKMKIIEYASKNPKLGLRQTLTLEKLIYLIS